MRGSTPDLARYQNTMCSVWNKTISTFKWLMRFESGRLFMLKGRGRLLQRLVTYLTAAVHFGDRWILMCFIFLLLCLAVSVLSSVVVLAVRFVSPGIRAHSRSSTGHPAHWLLQGVMLKSQENVLKNAWRTLRNAGY
ncbi:jg20619 [Pararge aegeria aegeria]|uniref:Jg20619 protein n=1 Tax=Pararge aegeria aegeria TaxID=348720 RepID=A0A8S4R4B0_9NEOP|nr:jg20619 [Pararge aegeria aegeria]